MQTNFTPEQLQNPRVAEADAILRRCVHCGLCTATCPTYVLLGDERDSPRGRIYLIKDMLEDNAPASYEVQTHLDRCLSCLSCMTTCPSGVDYMHLVDHGAQLLEQTGAAALQGALRARAAGARAALPRALPPGAEAGAARAPVAQAAAPLPASKELAAMIELAPAVLPPSPKFEGPGTAATEEERRARVIMLAGCAQQVLRPGINDSTIRLLARRGVDVVVAAGAGCCGALTYHLGDEAGGDRLRQAQRRRLVEGAGQGAGRRHHRQRLGLRHDGEGLRPSAEARARVCRARRAHLRAGARHLRVPRQVRAGCAQALVVAARRLSLGLLAAARPGHQGRAARAARSRPASRVADIPEGHICCGSAGTYNILQPEIAGALRDRKAKNIKRVKPDVVATGNIGCITQLAGSLDVPVVHTVELLDWAYGGPVPPGLEPLARFVSNVPEPKRRTEDFIHA